MLGSEHSALLLFNNFSAQCTPALLKTLDDNHINVVLLPPNCTDQLQPLDLSVNKPAKDFLQARWYQEWYGKQVCSQFEGKCERGAIALILSVMKLIGGQWMISLYEHFKRKPEIVRNGFQDIIAYLGHE